MLYQEGRGARSRASWLLACVLFAGAASAQAGATALSVTATVISKGLCSFRNAAQTLDFGTINPASGTTVNASTTLQVRCVGAGKNKTVTYNLQAGNGLHPQGAGPRRMQHATDNTEFMAYSLTVTPSSATIPTVLLQDISVTGTVAPADFQNARVGSYSDTVVLTLDP